MNEKKSETVVLNGKVQLGQKMLSYGKKNVALFE